MIWIDVGMVHEHEGREKDLGRLDRMWIWCRFGVLFVMCDVRWVVCMVLGEVGLEVEGMRKG